MSKRNSYTNKEKSCTSGEVSFVILASVLTFGLCFEFTFCSLCHVVLINFCLLHRFNGMRDGVSQREAAAELDLSRSFLQTLLKGREKILERSASETQANIKRTRTGRLSLPPSEGR